ncbi:MAG: single-stranded DNA-binding protein, partial [Clostridiales bacterium]|nr:single-stranded DNA-binding protein [Clostridiales bacterium]
AVCGQLQTRSYDDKEGNKRYATEVVADDVEFLGGGGDQAGNGGGNGSYERTSAPKKVSELKPVEDDGLPF